MRAGEQAGPGSSMSEKQAKKSRRLVLTEIVLRFEDGSEVNLDTRKVQLIDRETKEPLFNEVVEASQE